MNSYHKEKLFLDSLWSKAIKARDGICQICGAVGGDPHHSLVKRRANKTRWNLLNGILLCRKCHIEVENGKLKTEIQNAIDNIATPEQQESIRWQGKEIWKIHTGWLEEQAEYLKKMIKIYEK